MLCGCLGKPTRTSKQLQKKLPPFSVGRKPHEQIQVLYLCIGRDPGPGQELLYDVHYRQVRQTRELHLYTTLERRLEIRYTPLAERSLLGMEAMQHTLQDARFGVPF